MMNRVKYLLIFCIFIVLLAVFGKYTILYSLSKKDKNIQVNNRLSGLLIDKDILLDDGQKVILFEPNNKKIEKESSLKAIVPKSYISAESYLVGNLVTGERYIDYNSNLVFPIASVSKLYTALVVHHLFNLEKKITITQRMLDEYGTAGNLVLNEKLTPDELLYALLLESSNDAAYGLAESFGYNAFIENMNGFANEIGMHNTSFKDPSGLSSENISTVSDLFTLSKYLYKSEKGILKISSTKVIDLATTTDHGFHHFVNINPFVNYTEFSGGKTGRTGPAKEAMVSIFNQKVGNIQYPIAIIILRSDLGEREINTEKLLGMFIDKISKK